MSGRRHVWARIRRVWITVGLTATAIFVVWSLIAYRASAEARTAAASDAAVSVQRQDGIWHFASTSAVDRPDVGLLFFPGALVDPTAYAPLARAVAAAGF